MSAPLVKGLIIGTSLLLAAGLAIYESEQFRSWFDAQRRRIVITLESLAQNGASPETQRRRAQEMETELREEVVKRHRRDIIERAREEGVAVDLDELDAVESIYDAQQALLDEAAKNKKDRDQQAERGLVRRGTASSFDELVGHDGRLRQEHLSSGIATGAAQENISGLRQRGVSSGFARGVAFGANPFDDESAMLFDQDLIGAGGEELAALNEQRPRSRASTIRNIPVHDGSSPTQHERTTQESPYKSDAELEAEIQEAIRRSLEHEPVSEKPLIIVDDSPSAATTTDSQQMFQMPSSASSSALLHEPAAITSERSTSPMQGSIYESYYYGGRPNPTQQNEPSTPPAQIRTIEVNPSSSTSFHSALSSKLSALPPTSASQTPYAPSHSTLSPTISAVDADNDFNQEDSDWNSDDALTPAGTLTPTDDTLSLAGDNMSVVSPPVRSRTMSLAGAQSEAGESVAMSDFSDIGDGIHTPASWSEVESVSGEEEMEQSQQQRLGQQRRRRMINVQ